jgi:DNA polymerase III delta' subunit
VDGFLTVGQPAAAAAVHAMLESHAPHAVLLVGPASVGKLSLALDLAAGLLCTGAGGGDRPCRACRGCRMVEHGNHPDLHRLAPSGAGNQIRIGEDAHPEPGSIRRLAIDLSLLPVEGGERVAVIRDAQRMNEVAQSALLKTLEEPPPATTIVLCVDDEEQLLPTIRSRCARVRLGTLSARDVEQLLADRGLADAPTAARLARLAGGRPGIAVAYAGAPEAEAIRGELVRTLLDLLGRSRADRLGAARELLARSMTLAKALDPGVPAAAAPAKGRGRGKGSGFATGAALAAGPGAGPGAAFAAGSGAGGAFAAGSALEAASVGAISPSGDEPGAEAAEASADDVPAEGAGSGKATAADRRRALGLLLDLWRDLARDLACAQRGAAGSIRDVALLEELQAAARRLPPGAAGEALNRIVRAGELLEVNATPELVLDVLLVRWPRLVRAA